MSDLITIAKAGEPKIRILAAHWDAHKKLGWSHIADEPVVEEVEAIPEPAKAESKSKK